MWTWVRCTALVVFCIGLVAACSQPPGPSGETAALEGSLLTLADVEGGFEEESRGGVGVSGDKVCPEFKFEDVGMVRASFVWPLPGDVEVGLVESLRVAEPGELDTLFPTLRAAYDLCSGLVWTDYGQTQTVEVITAPDVGDDIIAVHAIHGDPPFDGRHDDMRIVYVRSGDIFIQMSVSETLESADDEVSVTDEEFDRIVAEAIAKLAPHSE